MFCHVVYKKKCELNNFCARIGCTGAFSHTCTCLYITAFVTANVVARKGGGGGWGGGGGGGGGTQTLNITHAMWLKGNCSETIE